MTLRVVPIGVAAARLHIETHHSHHHAPCGGLLAAAVADGDRVCCVALLGRPVGGGFGEQIGDHFRQAFGDVRVEAMGPWWGFIQNSSDHFAGGAIGYRPSACAHFEQYRPQAEQVGSLIQRSAL